MAFLSVGLCAMWDTYRNDALQASVQLVDVLQHILQALHRVSWNIMNVVSGTQTHGSDVVY